MSSREEAPVSDKLRALIERKRAYYEKFEGATFGEANKILAGHILQFCDELDAALAAGDGARITGERLHAVINEIAEKLPPEEKLHWSDEGFWNEVAKRL